MSKAQPDSLLRLAVSAARTLLPIFALTLAAVFATAPATREMRSIGKTDQYLNVRLAASLKTFEYAIVRRSEVTQAPPTSDDLLTALPECADDWRKGNNLRTSVVAIFRGDIEKEPPAKRIARWLGELDKHLADFSTRENRRVTEAVGLDHKRWIDAVRALLQNPAETAEYPGVKFVVECADIADAVATMLRSNARILDMLAWRGSEVPQVVARWRLEQFVEISSVLIARRDPWSGVRGCVYIGTVKGAQGESVPSHVIGINRSSESHICGHPLMFGAKSPLTVQPAAILGEPNASLPVNDARWQVPPSLHALLRPLDVLRHPAEQLYIRYTSGPAVVADDPTLYRFGPNRLLLNDVQVDVGFSIDLTIDPTLQALAQKIAACYTGRQDICAALKVRRAEDVGKNIGHSMLEHAVVRMAAVAVIDVASGEIEALAGSLSPCTREEFDGPGRSASCDQRLPYEVRYRPDALLNQAVFHDAMPASTIKPIMATAFLTDPEIGARWLRREQATMRRNSMPSAGTLRYEIMRSDSARFLDHMFCRDKGFALCQRPWRVQETARAFGWDRGCADATLGCGKLDLLFGRAVDATAAAGVVKPISTIVAYGRLMTEPIDGKLASPFRLMPQASLDPKKLRECAASGPDRGRWEQCRGGAIVDLVAEGWGQGHSRSSAVGIAGMMLPLAAAANNQRDIRRPHLVRALRGVGDASGSELQAAAVRWSLAKAEPNPATPDVAAVIMSGLSYGHRAGTSRSACEQVFDSRACQKITWLAGKTGTPTFTNDSRPLDEIARICSATKHPAKNRACAPLRPYKWYVATYTVGAPNRGVKVIGVLTERNWIASTGRVHAAGDRGPNAAAEIAMQIAVRHRAYAAGTLQ